MPDQREFNRSGFDRIGARKSNQIQFFYTSVIDIGQMPKAHSHGFAAVGEIGNDLGV